jgi:hypothetical protein
MRDPLGLGLDGPRGVVGRGALVNTGNGPLLPAPRHPLLVGDVVLVRCQCRLSVIRYDN